MRVIDDKRMLKLLGLVQYYHDKSRDKKWGGHYLSLVWMLDSGLFPKSIRPKDDKEALEFATELDFNFGIELLKEDTTDYDHEFFTANNTEELIENTRLVCEQLGIDFWTVKLRNTHGKGTGTWAINHYPICEDAMFEDDTYNLFFNNWVFRMRTKVIS